MQLFNGNNNFVLRQSVVKDNMIQQGIYEAFANKKPEDENIPYGGHEEVCDIDYLVSPCIKD